MPEEGNSETIPKIQKSRLERAETFLVQHLPKPLARIWVVARLTTGWNPELPTVDPLVLYNEFLEDFGKLFLTTISKQYPRINTLLMPSVGEPVRVRIGSYQEGQKEVSFNWMRQIEWAYTILDRLEHGETIDMKDIKEADLIIAIQDGITRAYFLLESEFKRHGLPVPPGVVLK